MSAGSFSAALTALKEGQFVRRVKWKDEFLILSEPASVAVADLQSEKLRHIVEDFPYAGLFDYGCIVKVTMVEGSTEYGWTPSPQDLLAEDWIIYDMEDVEMSKLEWELERAIRCHAEVTFDSLARMIVSQLEVMNIPIDEKDSLDFKQGADDREHLIILAGPDYRGITITTEDGGYTINVTSQDSMVGRGKLWVELQQLMQVLGKPTMSPRTFHRTLFSIEVLSEDPIPDNAGRSASLLRALTLDDLDLVVGTSRKVNETEVNAKQAVQVLESLGSEAGYFQLTPEGKDAE